MGGQEQERQLREEALRLLGARDRTRRELERRLLQRGADPQAVERVLDWLADLGYLDDRRFAEHWVRSRRNRWGPRKLELELREKGVDPEIVRAQIEAVSADWQDLRVAAALVRRRLERSQQALTLAASARDEERQRRRLVDYLLRRGFCYETAEKAVREVFSGEGCGVTDPVAAGSDALTGPGGSGYNEDNPGTGVS